MAFFELVSNQLSHVPYVTEHAELGIESIDREAYGLCSIMRDFKCFDAEIAKIKALATTENAPRNLAFHLIAKCLTGESIGINRDREIS